MLDTKNLIKLLIYSPHVWKIFVYSLGYNFSCYNIYGLLCVRKVKLNNIKKVKENLGGRYNFLLNNKKYKVRSLDKSNKDRGRENVINFLTLYPNLYLHRILLLYHFLL